MGESCCCAQELHLRPASHLVLTEMELLASDASPWQLDMGMRDTGFLMQLEGQLPQTEHHNGSMLYYQSFKNSNEQLQFFNGYKPRELANDTNVAIMSGPEWLPKPSKLNSCEINGDYYASPFPWINTTTQQDFYIPSNLNGLFDTLGVQKDENMESVAPPGTPSFQVELGPSQGLLSQGTIISPSVSLLSGFYQNDYKSLANSKCPSVPNKQSVASNDHIMAERKRREKLSQRFIALSAIVPGLKKKDKASILGDAVKYVKNLQERLQELEAQMPKKSSMVISRGNKRPASVSNCGSETDKNSTPNSNGEDSFDDWEKPEIEVRMVGKNVLIRIHCDKRKGVLTKCLAELEKLHLTVENANIVSFSEATLLLTFSAQMEDGFELTVEETLEELRKFFRKTK